MTQSKLVAFGLPNAARDKTGTAGYNRAMTYFFETYGCQMNIAESAAMERVFTARGWHKAADVQTADVVVVNTCSVRGSAEERVAGRLGYLGALKKARAGEARRGFERAAAYAQGGARQLTLIMAGCMAERLRDTLQQRWPCVDYVVGTADKSCLPQLLSCIERGERFLSTDERPAFSFAQSYWQEGTFSSFVPIMHGCNNFCSYCIVPYVRGREVSRPTSEIIAEVDFLSSQGVKEITLLGQNVNSYNADGTDFPTLLAALCLHLEKTGSPIEWVRFESSNPKDFSEHLVDTLAANPRVCRGFHIAVQHGSNAILRRMNRKYTREDFVRLVDSLRRAMSGCEISTDIMIGFPGETQADFDETLNLMRKVGFESAFMYYFNPRKGTAAATMEDQIPIDVKKARLARVIELQLDVTKEVMTRHTGETLKVLATSVSRDDAGELLGKTQRGECVAFKAPVNCIGQFVRVHIEALSGNTFRGTLL